MISATTFICNTFRGAFCLFESMATYLPIVDNMTVLDLGSEDGTWDRLVEIGKKNKRVLPIRLKGFSKIDASAFADAANWCVDAVPGGDDTTVFFWQADEILHENMLKSLHEVLKAGTPHAIWRYQLRENFQRIKWFPHPVHRIGRKGDFHFVGDGMNTDNYLGVPVLGDYDGGWFVRWGSEFEDDPVSLPTDQMMLDVSMIGGFRDNIPDRQAMHAPFWHQEPQIDGIPFERWFAEQQLNRNWTKPESPFNIPHIMRWHVGRTVYSLSYDLARALCDDDTERLLFP